MRYLLFICCLCLLIPNPLQANWKPIYSVEVAAPPVEPVYSAEVLPPVEPKWQRPPLSSELITGLAMLNGTIFLLGLVFFPIAIFNGWLMLANGLLYAEGFALLLGLLFFVFRPYKPGEQRYEALFVFTGIVLFLVFKGVELLCLGLIFGISWMTWVGIGLLLLMLLLFSLVGFAAQ